ncbi:MAG: YicC/YloC family endoribonuclease [Pseudomonadota bacterium]
MSDLSGMTGFARAAGEAEWGRWAWEAKSVNGRGLDVRVNAPPGFEAVEAVVKAHAKNLFSRGSVQLSLRLDVEAASGATLNEDVLDRLCGAWMRRAGRKTVSREALAVLMTTKGVIETASSDFRAIADDEQAAEAIAATAKQALDALRMARLDEGGSMKILLTSVLDEIDTLRASAAVLAAEQPGLVKARFEKRLAELEAERVVDPDRIAAEIAATAVKADVREELDRLAAHVETGRTYLADGGPKGRKLDFLSQELNREVNTLCSKSASLDLTNVGLSLKALIDQFKEQSANVE